MTLTSKRRDFLKAAAGVGASLSVGACATRKDASGQVLAGPNDSASTDRPAAAGGVADLVAPKMDVVRMGIVGVGGRGMSLLSGFLKIEGVQVNAVCDLRERHVVRAQRACVDAGASKPAGYFSGETDYRHMYERNDLDLVIVATPWRWHVPMSVEALKAGIHVGVEVPAAITVEGAWQLVETAEETRRNCIMLENCCYGESELTVLNMVRDGLFGELVHGAGAYIHDLREILFSGHGESDWRRQHSVDRNGNLYPTHGLGPIAQYMGINRGDRFDYLVSVASKARGMGLFAAEKFGPKSPEATAQYRGGDMSSTLIRTMKGRTISVEHDTTSPRPYDRINLIQGTRGTFRGYADRIYVEGRTAGHGWEDPAPYMDSYRHPLWKRVGEVATRAGGHGGMDFVMSWRLIYCLRNGLPLDMDVYDAAAWSVISPLSETSVGARSRSVDVPDFTRGHWEMREPLGIVS